jgi:acyl-CoA reductase-like NAD-dependent aldehyde dehydrogenase
VIMSEPQTDVKTYSYFVDNQWRNAQNDKTFEVHEPYSGKLFARVAAGTRADAQAGVDAAAKAFPGWAETTPAERAGLFLKASEIVRRRRTEIAEILARETGSTISFSTFQMDLVAATLQQVAGWVYLPKGKVLETNQPGTHSIGLRRPLGVCASFTPWNGANILSWRAVISPVAAGNTVVVKPSEFAPVSAGIMLAEVADEAGFPAGVINVVTCARNRRPYRGRVFRSSRSSDH